MASIKKKPVWFGMKRTPAEKNRTKRAIWMTMEGLSHPDPGPGFSPFSSSCRLTASHSGSLSRI